jgi:ABC-2 type transport system permease protein
MNQLLAIEWLKIKRYRTFWVLIGLFVLLLPIWNYAVANGFLKLGGQGKDGMNFLSTAYAFPQVWGNVGFWGSIFINFLSILVIILTTNEYAFRTNRQNVIDGWSKEQFYHSKVLLVVVLSVLVTVFLFIMGATMGAINSGSFSGMFLELQQVGYFFILSLDYLGFALFIAIWIKKSGLAIGLFMLYSLIIENILKGTINHFMDTPYGNFLPLQASDELLPFPLMQMAKAMMKMGNTLSMSTYVAVALLWCVIYYIAGRMILMRSDW